MAYCALQWFSFYTATSKRGRPARSESSFFGIIGYLIKPTAIFALASMALVEVAQGIRNRKILQKPVSQPKEFALKALPHLAAVTLAITLSFGLNGIAKATGPALNPEASFSSTHFLMMGFNSETHGCYSENDVTYSGSFNNADDRSKANIAEWLDRAETLGPIGTAKLMMQKTLTNYHDGTFAWAMEGNFSLGRLNLKTCSHAILEKTGTSPFFKQFHNAFGCSCF